MRAVLWGCYQIATGAALALAGPFLLVRRGKHYLPTLPGRLGGPAGEGSGLGRNGLWIHAVSVGEVGVAATLAQALPPEIPLLITTVTPTGQARARELFGAGSPRRAEVAYLPFDLGFAISRFFVRFSPRALVLVEGDYWPLLLREARRRGLPVAVVNGRIGDRSFRRMRRLRAILRPLFSAVGSFGVQSAADRDRLAALGLPAERIAVTGNLKFESSEPARKPELEAALRWLAGGRPILVAGSTMPGEEEQVLAAWERAGGPGRALLLLAPRHPERWAEVDALLRSRGLEVVRRSALEPSPPAPLPSPSHPGPGRGESLRKKASLVLLDSLGELASLYSLAAAAFIGGTLVRKGGHNPLEAVQFGVPVAVGPSMENFREMAEQFDRARAWRRAADADALGEIWKGWLDDPASAREQGARAAQLVEENRGALEKTLAMLGPMLRRLEIRD